MIDVFIINSMNVVVVILIYKNLWSVTSTMTRDLT